MWFCFFQPRFQSFFRVAMMLKTKSDRPYDVGHQAAEGNVILLVLARC